MPSIRASYGTHPRTGERGIWLELSSDPLGTIRGLAEKSYPKTSGKTLATFKTALQTALATQLGPTEVIVTITVSRLSPLSYGVEISDAAYAFLTAD